MTGPSKALSTTTPGSSLDDPDAFYVRVLDSLVEKFLADDGRIFLLDLGSGRYVSDRSLLDVESHRSWDARVLRSERGLGAVEQAASSRTAFMDPGRTWRLALPVLREKTAVGVVELWGHRLNRLLVGDSDRTMRSARGQLQQIADAYEAGVVHSVLEHTAQFKVDLFEDEATTLKNLMDFVAKSCGMQYVALRRLDFDDSLVSVQSRGFSDAKNNDLSFLNFSRDYEPFASVVATKNHWIAVNLNGHAYRAIRSRPELKDVRSFLACPVLLGTQIWGVLSFAAAVEYDYADLEVFALRALANLIGVALEAARTADTAAEDTFDDGRLMQAVLANEVVVATRHELDVWLEVVGVVRSTFFTIIEPIEQGRGGTRLSRREVAELMASAADLDKAHEQMNKIMGAVRVSQQDLVEKREPVGVLDVWTGVKDSFNFRINRARVTRVAKDVPQHLLIVGSADALRIALMQLMINSLDAFERGYSKDRREIGLRLESRNGGKVTLRYFDTAGGIIPGSLQRQGRHLSGQAEPEIGKLIFERYVTSKERGTGLGLASCRAALSVINGSIELRDWRRGITFDIDLDEWQD